MKRICVTPGCNREFEPSSPLQTHHSHACCRLHEKMRTATRGRAMGVFSDEARAVLAGITLSTAVLGQTASQWEYTHVYDHRHQVQFERVMGARA